MRVRGPDKVFCHLMFGILVGSVIDFDGGF